MAYDAADWHGSKPYKTERFFVWKSVQLHVVNSIKIMQISTRIIAQKNSAWQQDDDATIAHNLKTTNGHRNSATKSSLNKKQFIICKSYFYIQNSVFALKWIIYLFQKWIILKFCLDLYFVCLATANELPNLAEQHFKVQPLFCMWTMWMLHVSSFAQRKMRAGMQFVE